MGLTPRRGLLGFPSTQAVGRFCPSASVSGPGLRPGAAEMSRLSLNLSEPQFEHL